MRRLIVTALITMLFAASAPLAAHAAPPDDRAALLGVRSGKGVFDINLTRPGGTQLFRSSDNVTYEEVKAFQASEVRVVSENPARQGE